MKKLKLLLVVLLGLIVTGCTQVEEEKTMTCTRTINQQNMQMDLKYTIIYQGNYVKKVNSVEKITTEDINTLKNYKISVEQLYAPYAELEHYETEVTIDGTTLTSTANINYEKIDVDKLIEIDSANSQLFDNGKIKVETMEELYSQVGATCAKQ